MEPAGVGARNLSECILLQLQRLPDSSLACKIAGSALPLLAEKQTAAICRMLHCTQEQVAQAAALYSAMQSQNQETAIALPRRRHF